MTETNELAGLQIDRAAPLPVYSQIQQQMTEVIRKLRKRGVQKFFTDGDLSVHYGVSRMTARQATSELVRVGELYRRRGVGTFIAPAKAVETEGPVGDFFDDWMVQGHKVGVKVLQFRQEHPPQNIANVLRITERERILFFRRIRLLNDKPVSVDDRWVSPVASPLITRSDLKQHSIHLIVGPKLGIRIARAQVEIEAGRCPAATARLLRVKEGTPVLIRSITPFSNVGDPLWTGRSIYRSDLYKYKAMVAAP
ncbi:MAG TPA: GntR family transcriptional regulator [Alphaproteobacteria bacterium]|nr:GntR family transcriptional regulator [Alphaproteobacteria bacterium]